MADEVILSDLEDGLKRVMNNKKLYVKLLLKFKDSTKLDELEALLAAGDLEKSQGIVHTLKGLAANLSFTELFKQSLELETQIKAKAVNTVQLDALKGAFAKTLQEIDKVIAENG
jgi:HPt (histidine-containing phosphotransfer) domain-containing protein